MPAASALGKLRQENWQGWDANMSHAASARPAGGIQSPVEREIFDHLLKWHLFGLLYYSTIPNSVVEAFVFLNVTTRTFEIACIVCMTFLAVEVSSRTGVVTVAYKERFVVKHRQPFFMAVAHSLPQRQSWAVIVHMITKPQALTDSRFKEDHLLIGILE